MDPLEQRLGEVNQVLGISTGAGALRALKRAGFNTLADALNALGLERVPPADARVADIVMVSGEAPLDGC